MLTAGLVLVAFGSIIGGWAFMCDAMPPVNRPRLAWGPGPLLVAVVLAMTGSILLFFVKWYAGLAGIVGSIVAFNVCATVWSVLYPKLRL